MSLRSPYAWLGETAQRRALAGLTAACLTLMAALGALGGPLHSEAAPAGILTFEFAGSLERAQAILASWPAEARVYAGLGLGVDYLFLVVYAATIALACVRVAAGWSARSPRLADVGLALAWAQPLAALLDAAENYGLIRLLLGDAREGWARLAAACAAPKFAIVAAGLAYVLAGAAALAVRRR